MYASIFSSMNEEAILEELGRRLKRERLNINITQGELAEKIGVSKKTIQNTEKGENFSMATLVAILRGLNQLDQFDAFLPDPGLSPMQLMKLKGKERQRARSKTEAANDEKLWSWG